MERGSGRDGVSSNGGFSPIFRLPAIVLASLVAVAVAIFLIRKPAAERAQSSLTTDTLTYLGRKVCASCHSHEAELHTGSDHDRAMGVATEKTILGDFNNASFTNYGVTSSFFKRDGKYFVRPEGGDSNVHEYEIAYTFGYKPLQQYLIPFPRGRYEAL